MNEKKNFFMQTINNIKAFFTKGTKNVKTLEENKIENLDNKKTPEEIDELYSWLNTNEKKLFDIEVNYKYYSYLAYGDTKTDALAKAKAYVAGMHKFSKEELNSIRNTPYGQGLTIKDILSDETAIAFKARLQSRVDGYFSYGMSKEEALKKAKKDVECYNPKIKKEMGAVVFGKGIRIKFENEDREER